MPPILSLRATLQKTRTNVKVMNRPDNEQKNAEGLTGRSVPQRSEGGGEHEEQDAFTASGPGPRHPIG